MENEQLMESGLGLLQTIVYNWLGVISKWCKANNIEYSEFMTHCFHIEADTQWNIDSLEALSCGVDIEEYLSDNMGETTEERIAFIRQIWELGMMRGIYRTLGGEYHNTVLQEQQNVLNNK